MGRELQKKKKRSSIPKIKMKPKSKRVNPLGNAIIAANWNQSETLTQNYRRLGLTSRLNSATGGIEKLRPGETSKSSTSSKLSISNAVQTVIKPTEARVDRDPETGKIIRVIHAKSTPNPLNDPLNTDDEDEDEEMGDGAGEDEVEGRERNGNGNGNGNEIVRKLEEQASMVAEKKERLQSEREREWIERLVAKHGEDFKAMERDRRGNPMQQTAADIRKRVAKWRAQGGGAVAVVAEETMKVVEV